MANFGIPEYRSTVEDIGLKGQTGGVIQDPHMFDKEYAAKELLGKSIVKVGENLAEAGLIKESIISESKKHEWDAESLDILKQQKDKYRGTDALTTTEGQDTVRAETRKILEDRKAEILASSGLSVPIKKVLEKQIDQRNKEMDAHVMAYVEQQMHEIGMANVSADFEEYKNGVWNNPQLVESFKAKLYSSVAVNIGQDKDTQYVRAFAAKLNAELDHLAEKGNEDKQVADEIYKLKTAVDDKGKLKFADEYGDFDYSKALTYTEEAEYGKSLKNAKVKERIQHDLILGEKIQNDKYNKFATDQLGKMIDDIDNGFGVHLNLEDSGLKPKDYNYAVQYDRQRTRDINMENRMQRAENREARQDLILRKQEKSNEIFDSVMTDIVAGKPIDPMLDIYGKRSEGLLRNDANELLKAVKVSQTDPAYKIACQTIDRHEKDIGFTDPLNPTRSSKSIAGAMKLELLNSEFKDKELLDEVDRRLKPETKKTFGEWLNDITGGYFDEAVERRGGTMPTETPAVTEKTVDTFGYTLGQTTIKDGITYKYIGNDTWKKQ